MHDVSTLFTTLADDPDAVCIPVITIGTETYSLDDIVGIPTTSCNAFGDYGSLTIGLAASRSLTFTVLNREQEITDGMLVRLFVHYEKGDQRSETIQKGRYYVQKRALDEAEYTITITAYDMMLRLDDEDFPYTYTPPLSAYDWVSLIARLYSFDLDDQTTAILSTNDIYNGVVVSGVSGSAARAKDPQNYTIRSGLANVAALYGGSFVFSDEGKLRLISLTDLPSTNAHHLQIEPRRSSWGNKIQSVTRLRLFNDDGRMIEYGNTNGETLAIECSWAWPEDEYYDEAHTAARSTADILLQAIDNTRLGLLTPGRLLLAMVSPAVEIGDRISIGTRSMLVAGQKTYFDAACPSDVWMPTYDEIAVSSDLRNTRKQISSVREEIIAIATALPKRYETREPIAGEYVINQSNWDAMLAAGTWEQDVLYFPIPGL